MLRGARVVSWTVVFTPQTQKDARKLKRAGLKPQAEVLLAVLRSNPFAKTPPYEKLLGDLAGTYSRRITIRHRLVYQVYKKEKVIKVLRMWTHYE